MANFFPENLKKMREYKRLSQNKLGKLSGVNQTTIARWEKREVSPSIDNVETVCAVLDVDIPKMLGSEINFDSTTHADIDQDTIQIPVLRAIKSDIPIETQEDILEYVDIPKAWIKGGKQFYGLKISGDSMYPKYEEKDIVIFEQNEDYTKANNKDCAVMVNGYDATFKNVTISDNGITLVPLNLNNSEMYKPTFYSNEQIENLPVKIIGIAREKRTRY